MNRKKLVQTIFEKRSFLCVGLDPELSRLPVGISKDADGVLDFCKKIIDATRPFAVAYKPNTAFFEALGPEGWAVLAELAQHIGPDFFKIADAKRGDIGNTSRLYATAFFEKMDFDAITVAPYMGRDSVEPFLDFDEKWAIVLGLTSNAGADDFQKERLADGPFLYEKVLKTAEKWASSEKMMFVIGATQAAFFEKIRAVLPDHFFLVPGVGAQGGDLRAIARAGLTRDGGLLVNASRSIIFASNGPDFAEKAAVEAKKMQAEMADLLF